MPTAKPHKTTADTGERGTSEREAAERRRAVEETAGMLGGVYEPGELERLRDDWPE
jgi:hypothetical protein